MAECSTVEVRALTGLLEEMGHPVRRPTGLIGPVGFVEPTIWGPFVKGAFVDWWNSYPKGRVPGLQDLMSEESLLGQMSFDSRLDGRYVEICPSQPWRELVREVSRVRAGGVVATSDEEYSIVLEGVYDAPAELILAEEVVDLPPDLPEGVPPPPPEFLEPEAPPEPPPPVVIEPLAPVEPEEAPVRRAGLPGRRRTSLWPLAVVGGIGALVILSRRR